MAMMIFVNHAGHGVEWITHAAWDGVHLADLIMPSFLVLLGASVVLSLGTKSSTPRRPLLAKVLARAGAFARPALNTVTWDAACDSILIAHFAMLDTVAPFTGLQRRTLVWLLPGVANQHAQWHRNIWTGNTIPVAAAAALVFELVPLHHSPTCAVATPHRWAVLAWSCGMTCLWAWRGCHEALWHWGCSIAGLVSTPRNSG